MNPKQHPAAPQAGFTLVEMSVVLAVIGMLIGGVFAGQSLLDRSRLAGVMKDLSQYRTAYYSFLTQYKAMPGDMPDATEYWGSDTSSSCTNSPVAGDRVVKKETCNGNGSNSIMYNASPAMITCNLTICNQIEAPRAWQHLANAGYVDLTVTGVGTSTGPGILGAGQNAPTTPFSAVTTGFFTLGTMDSTKASNMGVFPGNYGTMLAYGAVNAISIMPTMAFLTPQQLLNMDSKIDDGLPGTGALRPRYSAGDCTTTNVVSTARYDLSKTSTECGILYTIDTRAING